MNYTYIKVLTFFSLILTSCAVNDIYVNTNGSDQNDGSINHPVATIQKAQEIARQKANQVIETPLG